MFARKLALILGGLCLGLAFTSCASGGAAPQSPSASSAPGTTCTQGWSCVDQAQNRLSFVLLTPPVSTPFVSLIVFQSASHVTLLEWRDVTGGSVKLASYDTLAKEEGKPVSVRGTQGYLQMLGKGSTAEAFLTWSEGGRWQLLSVPRATQQQILTLAQDLTSHR
ncbi:MAG TPA: hypothetical protein VGD55_04290 [Acidothermaceae bacterium]